MISLATPRRLNITTGSTVEKKPEDTRKNNKGVREWLTFQDTYTLHKPVRKSFLRRRVLVDRIDDQWQIDLINTTQDSFSFFYD